LGESWQQNCINFETLLFKEEIYMKKRLLHDFEVKEYNYRARSADPKWPGKPHPPETVPLWKGIGGGKDDIILTPAYMEYLRRINTPAAFKFICWRPAGWFNMGPRGVDTLGFGGNVVEVEEVIGKVAKIKTLKLSVPPPHPDVVNHKTYPELIHKFTVITKKGKIIQPGKALAVYIFLISKEGYLYVPLSRVAK
jgi:hypothetical protein